MIVYWLLFIPTAFIAYLFGSMDTMVLASNYVFRANLLKLGKGNDWLSNFRRVYGIKGALGLLVVEVIKDIVPIVIGGLLLSIKGHPEAGRAFAGFCLVMGRCWPVFYNLRGSMSIMPFIFCCLLADTSLGIVCAIVFIVALVAVRYSGIAAIAAALLTMIASLLIIEDEKIIIVLIVFAGLSVVFRNIPAVKRTIKGQEEKLALREDLGYKFDAKF